MNYFNIQTNNLYFEKIIYTITNDYLSEKNVENVINMNT